MKKYIPFKRIDPKQIYKGPISAEPTNTCVDLVIYNPKLKIGSKNQRRDLLRKHNISTYPNYVVTLDVTKMGVNGQCITAQDVATRKILAYVYKEAPLDSQYITDCILAAIEDAGGNQYALFILTGSPFLKINITINSWTRTTYFGVEPTLRRVVIW